MMEPDVRPTGGGPTKGKRVKSGGRKARIAPANCPKCSREIDDPGNKKRSYNFKQGMCQPCYKQRQRVQQKHQRDILKDALAEVAELQQLQLDQLRLDQQPQPQQPPWQQFDPIAQPNPFRQQQQSQAFAADALAGLPCFELPGDFDGFGQQPDELLWGIGFDLDSYLSDAATSMDSSEDVVDVLLDPASANHLPSLDLQAPLMPHRASSAATVQLTEMQFSLCADEPLEVALEAPLSAADTPITSSALSPSSQSTASTLSTASSQAFSFSAPQSVNFRPGGASAGFGGGSGGGGGGVFNTAGPPAPGAAMGGAISLNSAMAPSAAAASVSLLDVTPQNASEPLMVSRSRMQREVSAMGAHGARKNANLARRPSAGKNTAAAHASGPAWDRAEGLHDGFAGAASYGRDGSSSGGRGGRGAGRSISPKAGGRQAHAKKKAKANPTKHAAAVDRRKQEEERAPRQAVAEKYPQQAEARFCYADEKQAESAAAPSAPSVFGMFTSAVSSLLGSQPQAAAASNSAPKTATASSKRRRAMPIVAQSFSKVVSREESKPKEPEHARLEKVRVTSVEGFFGAAGHRFAEEADDDFDDEEDELVDVDDTMADLDEDMDESDGDDASEDDASSDEELDTELEQLQAEKTDMSREIVKQLVQKVAEFASSSHTGTLKSSPFAEHAVVEGIPSGVKAMALNLTQLSSSGPVLVATVEGSVTTSTSEADTVKGVLHICFLFRHRIFRVVDGKFWVGARAVRRFDPKWSPGSFDAALLDTASKRTVLQQGKASRHIWRFRNTGNHVWDHRVVVVSEGTESRQCFLAPTGVKPGEEVAVAVTINAPNENIKNFERSFRLHSFNQPFGPVFTVRAEVV